MSCSLISYMVEDSRIVIVGTGVTGCLYVCIFKNSFDEVRYRYITGGGVWSVCVCSGKGGGVSLTCENVLHFIVGREEGGC